MRFSGRTDTVILVSAFSKVSRLLRWRSQDYHHHQTIRPLIADRMRDAGRSESSIASCQEFSPAKRESPWTKVFLVILSGANPARLLTRFKNTMFSLQASESYRYYPLTRPAASRFETVATPRNRVPAHFPHPYGPLESLTRRSSYGGRLALSRKLAKE
jgi:hypothetical protein